MKIRLVSNSVALAVSTIVVSASALAATPDKAVMKSAVKASPAASGVLFGLGRSELTDFDIKQSLTDMGYSGIIGGDTDSDVDISLGYRHGFSNRFSMDVQYVQQNISETPLGVTVTSGTELAAATAISRKLPKLAQGFTVAGVYHAPLSPRVSAKIGGGAFLWEGKRETEIGSAVATAEDNGTSLMLQLGLGYRATTNVSVEGSLQRFFMPDDSVDRLSLGVVYHF